MNGKIDLGGRALLSNCANGIVDLLCLAIPEGARLTFRLHDRRRLKGMSRDGRVRGTRQRRRVRALGPAVRRERPVLRRKQIKVVEIQLSPREVWFAKASYVGLWVLLRQDRVVGLRRWR